METNVSNDVQGKNIAIISYLTVIGLVLAFVMNNEKKEPFASFHIRQSLGLVITSIALAIINVIPVLGWIVSIIGYLVLLYMWIVGLLNAVNCKEKVVPILGNKYTEWFKTI